MKTILVFCKENGSAFFIESTLRTSVCQLLQEIKWLLKKISIFKKLICCVELFRLEKAVGLKGWGLV